MPIRKQSEVYYSRVFYRPKTLKVGEEILENKHKLAGKYCYTKKSYRKRNPYDLSPKEYLTEYSFFTEQQALESLRKKSIIDRIGDADEMCKL